MHVTTAGVVLFLHIAVAIVAFSMAGIMHVGLQMVARGGRVEEIRSWSQVMHRIEPLFPVMALALLGLGAWLVHLGDNPEDGFGFGVGWILTAIVTLVVVEAIGGAVLAPRGKALSQMVHEAADGAVPANVSAAVRDPALWYAAHVTTGAFLAVVFVMAAKPDGAWAVLFVAIGAVVGALASRAQLQALPAAGGAASVPGQRAIDDPTSVRSS
jgi:hypothetical protein